MSATSKTTVGLWARERALDVALGTLGVTTAVAATAFAGYMALNQAPARQARPGGAIAAFPVPTRHMLSAAAPDAPDTDAPDEVDLEPTGTIPPVDESPSRRQAASDASRVLSDFAVRDAFDGTALVEAHGALRVVEPGTRIEGAGTVTAIERVEGAWIVRTTGGAIRQRR